jgi:hypothetical protein
MATFIYDAAEARRAFQMLLDRQLEEDERVAVVTVQPAYPSNCYDAIEKQLDRVTYTVTTKPWAEHVAQEVVA